MKQALWLKLGSIAVHAEEILEKGAVPAMGAAGVLLPGAHELDIEAIRGLLADKEVRRFLDAPVNKVLLPRKRSEDRVDRTPRNALDTSQ